MCMCVCVLSIFYCRRSGFILVCRVNDSFCRGEIVADRGDRFIAVTKKEADSVANPSCRESFFHMKTL